MPCVNDSPQIICDKTYLLKFPVKSFQDELHVYGESNSIFTVSTYPRGRLCAKIAKVNGETLIP